MTYQPEANYATGTTSHLRDASCVDIDTNSQLEGLFSHASLAYHTSNASEVTLQAGPLANEKENLPEDVNVPPLAHMGT